MKRSKLSQKKICLVGSSGGHLAHLYALKPVWEDKDRFWVTFNKEDANSLLENENVYHCYYPSNRSLKGLIKNTRLAWKTMRKEHPDVIISTGAAVAVPFFYIGKLFGAKTVYIEVLDRLDRASLTGRLVESVTDLFVVQWAEAKKIYKNAVYIGSIQ